MWDTSIRAIAWLLFAFSGVQAIIFIGLIVWGAWHESIKPRLIPDEDIDREADAIIAGYADPEREAFARHERAWHRSEGAEQVYWHRVRKAVRRRSRMR